MILLFLGSLRSTAIVAVSIPLSILTSIIVLGAIGQSLNTMTLGGLALAVGILVDDTTVTVENINRYLGLGLPLRRAILDGSAEIALPALVSTLSICIVFMPVVLLSGVAKYLFVPLAESVVFAMLASYFLSRTVTPTFVAILLKDEAELYAGDYHNEATEEAEDKNISPSQSESANGNGRPKNEAVERIKNGWVWRMHEWFNEHFERLRDQYRHALAGVMRRRLTVGILFGAFFLLSFCLVPFIGRDFFPAVDAGQLRLHVRVPSSTRLEETASIFGQVENDIRTVIPAKETDLVLDNIGEPIFINLAYSDTATVGPSDGEIDVSLKEGHKPVAQYMDILRAKLAHDFPEETFFFQPADIVSQILNFGLPSPIDVQVSGPMRNQKQDLAVAEQLRKQMAGVPGAADVHLQQIVGAPALNVNVDRTRAMQVGLTQQAVASSLLVSLAGTGQAAPSYWLDPKNGVNYTVVAQTPQYKLSTPDDLLSTPLTAPGLTMPEQLSNVAQVDHDKTDLVINHYNIQPVYDVYSNSQNRDLGGIADEINKIVDQARKHLPRGSTLAVRGQVATMNDSFAGLGFGIIGSVILVYLLLTVNFQSWVDPLVVVCGVPGALIGVLWMLYATQTTINVPSLMGAIMSIGVSTANSVLLVTFANERRLEGKSAIQAAIDAGATRMRPILMTAIAMIVGMIPMALGLGEGGEQNAPLGRAVIGGLLVATFTTLFFVPVIYSVLRNKQPEPILGEDD
jgi:multidrug efflux pump subunit AcrB